ncbi:acyl carrier protein [Actinomarinicola tropica]|uniref:Acyl carrier protein n=1 Tax=Actinomarinicola tropica TaxID=2789776 RepID=A0A5Q2RLA4_9ACTN|nr:acyl carrier protein [Actinomarinicola tropica]QGG96623.1 acyl carrier protein [Actinomarinicola tropica]
MNTEQALAAVADALHGIAPEADIDEIDSSGALQEELDLDSMDFLNLVVAIDQRTGVEIPERDYPRVASLDGLVAYLVAATG